MTLTRHSGDPKPVAGHLPPDAHSLTEQLRQSGIPDPDFHRICRRCRRWFEPHEVAEVLPEVTGPFGAIRRLRTLLSTGRTKGLYQCHRCTMIRRLTSIIITAIFVGLVAIILVLDHMSAL